MALSQPSLLLYGFEVTQNNRYIDFKPTNVTTVFGTMNIGTYTFAQFLTEVARAMTAADPAHVYTVSADRSTAGGLQNRVTIATSNNFLTLLFGSGAHNASNPASLLGFDAVDRTGATSYVGIATAGFALTTVYPGYTFVDPRQFQEVFGSVNLSASGDKEAIVWQIQQFIEIAFQHEPLSKVNVDWLAFFQWAIQQKPFDFTPEYPTYGTYYEVTLETTEQSGQGLAFQMKEQLPSLPGLYSTGKLKMRRIVAASTFL